MYKIRCWNCKYEVPLESLRGLRGVADARRKRSRLKCKRCGKKNADIVEANPAVTVKVGKQYEIKKDAPFYEFASDKSPLEKARRKALHKPAATREPLKPHEKRYINNDGIAGS